jgi:hypothetical protein
MTTVLIDNHSPAGLRLLKEIAKHPRIAQIIDDSDNLLSPVSEEELISLQEFKEHFERRIFERLGLTVSL